MLLPLKTSHQFEGKEGKAGIWENVKHFFLEISFYVLLSPPLCPLVCTNLKGQVIWRKVLSFRYRRPWVSLQLRQVSALRLLCDLHGPQGLHW